jgi:hypothetical protein
LTTTGATAGSSTPPVFRSNSSQFIFLKRVDPAPDTAIRELDGTIINLGRFRGKVVILNLWATWCLPFMKAYQLAHLSIGLDPEERLGSLSADRVAAGALPLWGLPITYLIDKRGLVIGYITGAVSWESREAQSFLAYFMNLN